MTNQRAISHLKDISMWGIIKADEYNAIKMAIKALEQKSNTNYKAFAEWVADEIFNENWEGNKGAFSELACRRLEKLGVVKADGDKWKLKGG